MIFLTFGCICTVGLWLLVWFKTKAIVEYLNIPWTFLNGLRDVLKINSYNSTDTDLSYPEFLAEYYNNFFTRLISCPICLSVWLGMILSVPIWIFGGLVAYLTGMPIVTVFGLLLYLITIKML